MAAFCLVAISPLGNLLAAPTSQPTADGWQSLFDGKTLGKWVSTNFGGEGEVSVDDGSINLQAGVSLTGVTYKGPTPRMNYEVVLDAQRVEGTDFFCGLTVPVGDSYCSLIVGGWGGSLCGISSLDGRDAARNETRSIHNFQKGKWYHIRLRVMPDRLMAWIDDQKIVDVSTKGRTISVRAEVQPSEPFGISSFQTTAAIKDIRIREVPASEAGSKK